MDEWKKIRSPKIEASLATALDDYKRELDELREAERRMLAETEQILAQPPSEVPSDWQALNVSLDRYIEIRAENVALIRGWVTDDIRRAEDCYERARRTLAEYREFLASPPGPGEAGYEP